jgi:hypothetical protein
MELVGPESVEAVEVEAVVVEAEPFGSVLVDAVANEAARDRLDARVGVLAAQIHALSAELVDTIAEFDAVSGSQGYSSTAQWLSVRAGFSTGEARRLCALARRAEQMPTLMRHARAGQLSTGVLTTAARVVTADNEERVAEIAVSCTPAQSARILSTYRSIADPPDPDTPDPDPDTPIREHDTWWRSWFDDQGRGRIDAALSPDVAALVDQAWAAARTAGEADHTHTPPGDPADAERDHHARLCADEIAARLATTMLDTAHDHGLCRPGGDRHGVLVNIDVATLARVLGLDIDPALPIGLGTQAFDAHTGAHLADHEVARFLCDADIQVLVHHRGVPLWMSHTTRTANRHQRRALRFRASGTGGCEYPGCTQTRYLDAHHVTFHRHHGPTALDNMVLLCGHHHRALHRDEFTITTDGDQRFTFTDRWGALLGTTTTSQDPGGPPPDLAHLPHLDRPPAPPPDIRPDTPHSVTGGEHLTPYALDVYLHHLLTA